MDSDGIDPFLEEQLRSAYSRLEAHPRLAEARYRSLTPPVRRSRLMKLLPSLPAVLATKGAMAGLTIAALAAAGGATTAIVTSSSHHSGPTPSASETPEAANGHAANANAQGAHGQAVTHAVASCTPGPGFGACVSAVASGGRSENHETPEASPDSDHETGRPSSAPNNAVGPPSPRPSSPVDHPTGEPSSPGAVGPPSPLPSAPVRHPEH